MSDILTREDMMAYLESSFQSMSEEEKDTIITSDGISDLTPRTILGMVRGSADHSQEYLNSLIAVFNYR